MNVEVMSGGSPPELAGGFGDVGEAMFCHNKMAAGTRRLREIEQNVVHDAVNSSEPRGAFSSRST